MTRPDGMSFISDILKVVFVSIFYVFYKSTSSYKIIYSRGSQVDDSMVLDFIFGGGRSFNNQSNIGIKAGREH